MKIRDGFVANSSSSSYMIATQGELTKEALMSTFVCLPEDNFFYPFMVDVIETLIRNIEERYLSVEQFITDTCDDTGWTAEEVEARGYYKEQLDLLREGWKVHVGSVSNDGYDSEPWLTDQDIEYRDDSIIIVKAGGF